MRITKKCTRVADRAFPEIKVTWRQPGDFKRSPLHHPMTPFEAPTGTNFRSESNVPADVVSKSLCRIASFLQDREPYQKLLRYDDWWEHDGLHFPKGPVDFHGLFEIIGSPRALLAAMPGDDYVVVGIAPQDNSWYLRFFVDWDDADTNLVGRFDITLPEPAATAFRDEVAQSISHGLTEQDAQGYYDAIRL
jgi:hypothetical protein